MLETYPDRGNRISLQLFITCFFRQMFSSGDGSYAYCILMFFRMVLCMLEAYPDRGILSSLQLTIVQNVFFRQVFSFDDGS